MRPVHLADIEVAARVLLAYPQSAHNGIMSELIKRADVADRNRKRWRKPHPMYGAGTIMSAAAHFRQAARPSQIDANTLDALGAVIKGLSDRHTNQLL